jgi:hypothetical protein
MKTESLTLLLQIRRLALDTVTAYDEWQTIQHRGDA